MRLPDEYVTQLTNPNAMTLNEIKLDIASCLNEANNQDNKDGLDGGFIVASLDFVRARQALALNEVLKSDMEDAEFIDKNGYMSAARVAKELGITLTVNSYASYMNLVRKLFAHIVSRAHTLWPELLCADPYVTWYTPTERVIEPASLGKPCLSELFFAAARIKLGDL
jgi:hypothetical protein